MSDTNDASPKGELHPLGTGAELARLREEIAAARSNDLTGDWLRIGALTEQRDLLLVEREQFVAIVARLRDEKLLKAWSSITIPAAVMIPGYREVVLGEKAT